MAAETQLNADRAQPRAGDTQLSKFRIAKKAYVFDVKRKYAATRQFSVKKKPETPAEDILASLTVFFQKKKSSGQPEKKAMQMDQPGKNAPKQPSFILNAVKIAFVLLLLFFLAVGFIVLQFGAQPPSALPVAQSSEFGGNVDFSVLQSRIISTKYSENPSGVEGVAYLLVDYNSKNLSSLNFSAYAYKEKPPVQVFMLDHVRESAYNYPIFKNKLVAKLSSLGISANDIGLESLDSLPGGAILLVSTGYFPASLMPGSEYASYDTLLSRGIDIVYVGYPFDTTVLDLGGSTTRVSNKDFRFSPSKPASSSGFELYDPQYTVEGAALIYGSVSAVNRGAGTFVFLPQTLDGGWVTDDRSDGSEKAATDLARLISEQAWRPKIAEASATVFPQEGKSDSGNGKFSLFSTPLSTKSVCVELFSDSVDANGFMQRKIDIFQIGKPQLGEVWVKDDLAIPYFFTGQKTRLNLQLREPDSQPVKLYVALYKDGELLQRSDLEFGFTNPTIDKSVDFSVDAPPGSYVMSVVNEQEKVYAATKLDVLDVDIGANSTQWAQGKFTFILSAGGKPLSPRYVSVKMDGRLPRDYSAQDLSKIAGKSFLTYDYPDKIETGDHVFSFTFGDYQKDVGINYYKSPQMWENPWVVGIGLLSLAIFCMGYFLKRPEAIRYGLDVPDFPPISAIKIPVKREAVLEIFDNVNLGYSWRYMPLRSEELKGGFRKLTYNGKPILIGDFNLDRILSKLKVEGLVKNELDYWGLLRWEKESGHSMHYLTIYRIMRNVFVNNAVKFSKMDSMPDCDIKIVAGKEEIYLHIMEAPADRVAHRALATAKKGTTLVIFKTQDELDSFSASLTSTSKLAVGIKMEIQNRNIILMTAKISLAAYLKQILT